MDLSQLIRFAKAYNYLGWAIQEQLDDIIEGDTSDINPEALKQINQTLRGFNDELDELIDEAQSATA